MCYWKNWIWPGIITAALLTLLATFFTRPGVEEELTSKAMDALKANHPWAAVALSGRDLTLTGTAPDEAAQMDALKAADTAYDVRVAYNNAGLLPKADPYIFGAVKSDDGVTLTGNVPSETVRAAIAAAAAKALPGVAVTDKMTLAAGMPEGFDALAAYGLGQRRQGCGNRCCRIRCRDDGQGCQPAWKWQDRRLRNHAPWREQRLCADRRQGERRDNRDRIRAVA
jgi:hypothetical protein